MMTLVDWQKRLDQHFRRLREERSAAVGNKPIFALEHGLDTFELQELDDQIRSHITQFPPSDGHTLPWIVYAAEIGYGYLGDEYWQTFEQKTPGWSFGEREWLRRAFQWFHRQYGGAEPCGAWADHFSIICWPITHSILPHDLQHHLARILYEIRHIFSSKLLDSPAELGERIAARSWEATSRFQNLAQDTLLIGQIAAGLLFEGERGTGSLIFPPTLKRIGADLDRERRARDWLKSARRLARDRVELRGLSRAGPPGPPVARPPVEVAREKIAALAIEPRLVLRPTGGSTSSWKIFLEIPDLSYLLTGFPDARRALADSRCVVAGSSGRPLARGLLLHGPHSELLIRWPNPEEVLLHFEQSTPELDYLLRTECLLRPGPVWLFRVAPDGLAYEMRSLRVRPEHSYIILSTRGPLKHDPPFSPVSISCESVHAARLDLDLSSKIPLAWVTELMRMGLRLGRSIRVWPTGLTAISWDDEGRGEWLSSERPSIAICTDHEVDSFKVSLAGYTAEDLEISSIRPGDPVFLELQHLPVGIHKLRVSARPTLTSGGEDLIGELDVFIREPHPWAPGLSTQGPFSVSMEPMAPTLEQLWEGRVAIEIRGPQGRHVVPIISLFEKREKTPSIRRKLEPLILPVDPGPWRDSFEKQFRGIEQVQNTYDSAYSCTVELIAEELGTYSFGCERAFTPIRWTIQRKAGIYHIRLIDDSDLGAPLATARYSFDTPDIPVQVDSKALYHTTPASEGMYFAQREESWWAQIVPPLKLTIGQIPAPYFLSYPRSTEGVIGLLQVIERWGKARIPGNVLGVALRRRVLRSATQRLFGLIAGGGWEHRESFCDGEASSSALPVLRDGLRGWEPGNSLGAVLFNEVSSFAAMSTPERTSELARLALNFKIIRMGPVDPQWLVESALRIASEPWTARGWAGSTLQNSIEVLLRITSLARAARFLVLAVDRQAGSFVDEGIKVYSGWGWDL
jgi:hypothetical protein